MLEKDSKVIITSLGVEGEVIEEFKEDILVKHAAKIDGQTKMITQWYKKSAVKEIKSTHKSEVLSEGNVDSKNESVVEVMAPKSSNSRGVRSKKIEFGIVSEKDEKIIEE